MKAKNRIWIYPLVIMGFVLMYANSCKKDDNNDNSNITVIDKDGNQYNTVTIGSQVWMKENLKTTKYRDGIPIQYVTDNHAWSVLTTGAYCDYNNTASNSDTYGRLYNWYAAADTHQLCPTGWHVPTDAEWTILTTFLGGGSVAGGKLKEAGSAHWNSPNTGADNSSGFCSLPGGLCSFDGGGFMQIGEYSYCWSSTEFNTLGANYLTMECSSSIANLVMGTYKSFGFSVRCLRD
jgi:uncharacterized protein (TIGR02145 family)